jgi:hypothetical protein
MAHLLVSTRSPQRQTHTHRPTHRADFIAGTAPFDGENLTNNSYQVNRIEVGNKIGMMALGGSQIGWLSQPEVV